MAHKGEGGGMTLALRKLDLTPDERTQAIIALGRILDEFRKINPLMPVAQVQAFLMVALDTGQSMSEISDVLGIKNPTGSRYLMEMGPPRVDNDGAFGLVERGVDPQNTRRARYTLSKKGEKLVKAIVAVLAEGE
jgi:DNA-binding MarR family transcriptional regulator